MVNNFNKKGEFLVNPKQPQALDKCDFGVEFTSFLWKFINVKAKYYTHGTKFLLFSFRKFCCCCSKKLPPGTGQILSTCMVFQDASATAQFKPEPSLSGFTDEDQGEPAEKRTRWAEGFYRNLENGVCLKAKKILLKIVRSRDMCFRVTNVTPLTYFSGKMLRFSSKPKEFRGKFGR